MIIYGIIAIIGFVILGSSTDKKKTTGKSGTISDLCGFGFFVGVVMLAIGLLAYPYNWIFGEDEKEKEQAGVKEQTEVAQVDQEFDSPKNDLQPKQLKGGFSGRQEPPPDKTKNAPKMPKGPRGLVFHIKSKLDFTAVDAAGGLRPRTVNAMIREFGEPDKNLAMSGGGFMMWTRHTFVDQETGKRYRNLNIPLNESGTHAWSAGVALLK